MMSQNQQINRNQHTIDCDCPSCRQVGQFTYLGKQEYPKQVAEAAGLPTTIHLWTCPNCLTTVNEIDLRGTQPR